MTFTLDDTVITNPARFAARVARGYAPVQSVVTCPQCREPRSENLTTIRNVSIFDSHPRPFFAAGNLSCAISASFRVHNPHGCQVQLGEEPKQRLPEPSSARSPGRKKRSASNDRSKSKLAWQALSRETKLDLTPS